MKHLNKQGTQFQNASIKQPKAIKKPTQNDLVANDFLAGLNKGVVQDTINTRKSLL
jgi:hypothetical protein